MCVYVSPTVRAQFGCEVTVFDVDPAVLASARSHGFATVSQLSAAPHAYDVITGCSGYAVLQPHMHRRLFKHNTVLVSASSGNHELGFDVLVGSPGVVCHTPQSLTDPARIHDTVTLELLACDGFPSQKLHYVNGGFPVTFVGRLHSVPSNSIASTILLMVAGAAQAAEALAVKKRVSASGSGALLRGVHALNPQVDQWAFTHAYKL